MKRFLAVLILVAFVFGCGGGKARVPLTALRMQSAKEATTTAGTQEDQMVEIDPAFFAQMQAYVRQFEEMPKQIYTETVTEYLDQDTGKVTKRVVDKSVGMPRAVVPIPGPPPPAGVQYVNALAPWISVPASIMASGWSASQLLKHVPESYSYRSYGSGNQNSTGISTGISTTSFSDIYDGGATLNHTPNQPMTLDAPTTENSYNPVSETNTTSN